MTPKVAITLRVMSGMQSSRRSFIRWSCKYASSIVMGAGKEITYADGRRVRAGDQVDLDGHAGIIEVVVDGPEAQVQWGVSQRGAMIRTESFGLVFQPIDTIDWTALELVERCG